MSGIAPSGKKIPSEIVTLESGIAHLILVGSRIYAGKEYKVDSTSTAPVIEYYLFEDGNKEARFGARLAFKLDPAWNEPTSGSFWQSVQEVANVELPIAYYEDI